VGAGLAERLLLGGNKMAEIGGLRTVRYWEADGVSGRRLMLRPFSKGSNSGNDRVGQASPLAISTLDRRRREALRKTNVQ
jgi:hypothetical protein